MSGETLLESWEIKSEHRLRKHGTLHHSKWKKQPRDLELGGMVGSCLQNLLKPPPSLDQALIGVNCKTRYLFYTGIRLRQGVVDRASHQFCGFNIDVVHSKLFNH